MREDALPVARVDAVELVNAPGEDPRVHGPDREDGEGDAPDEVGAEVAPLAGEDVSDNDGLRWGFSREHPTPVSSGDGGTLHFLRRSWWQCRQALVTTPGTRTARDVETVTSAMKLKTESLSWRLALPITWVPWNVEAGQTAGARKRGTGSAKRDFFWGRQAVGRRRGGTSRGGKRRTGNAERDWWPRCTAPSRESPRGS